MTILIEDFVVQKIGFTCDHVYDRTKIQKIVNGKIREGSMVDFLKNIIFFY